MNEEWEKMENLPDDEITENDDLCISQFEKELENTTDLNNIINNINDSKENENE